MYTQLEHPHVIGPARAAICMGSSREAIAVLEAVVKSLEAEGLRVAGPVISGDSPAAEDSARDRRGAELLAELESKVDLVVFTRFDDQEIHGLGYCPVFRRATQLGIPVLTIVTTDCQQRWHDFDTGDLTTLPGDQAAVLDWCHTNVERPAATQRPRRTPQNFRPRAKPPIA